MPPEKPLADVGVIIPTADREMFLRSAIQSVLSQTVLPKEIIVVDNGLNPARIPHQVPNLSIIRTNPRIGCSGARNVGAKHCTAGILSFLDDDDVWHKEYLEKVINAFRVSNPDAVIGELRKKRGSAPPVPFKMFPKAARLQRQVYFRNPGVTGSNLSVARIIYQSLGGFDESMKASEDRDLAARLLQANCSIITEPSAVAIQTNHDSIRARDNIAEGNYQFIIKHKDMMTTDEFDKAMRIYKKRLKKK